MRFLHLADLHFGKFLHGLSLLESGDQSAWTERFLDMARELRPDAVVIAGDVYDRATPSGGAVELLDRFLTALSGMDIPVMLTAGNHDSAQRLSFASGLLPKAGVYISRTLSASPELVHVTLRDADGPVTFWLMPYVFPALAAQVLNNDRLRDYDAAVRALLAAQPVDFSQRNVLIAHQNVTAHGMEVPRGGSETMVGGVGQVDYTAFDGFDYVALGHIHAAYPVGRESVRYAGSPLCYHFSETRQRKKGPILVELGAKGVAPVMSVQDIPPLHPMREVRGPYAEIREREIRERRKGEYIRVVLTDCKKTPEISNFFQSLYEERGSVLMELQSEYQPYQGAGAVSSPEGAEEKPLEELFADCYEERLGTPPEERDADLIAFAAELTRHAENVSGPPTQESIEKLLRFALEQEECL